MVVTAEQMAAALTVTGNTPEKIEVRNILHYLPRVSNFTVQFLHHQESCKFCSKESFQSW
jgi:hypothetical protein